MLVRYVPLVAAVMESRIINYGLRPTSSLLRPAWWLLVLWVMSAAVYWRWSNWWSWFDKKGDGSMIIWFEFPSWFQLLFSLAVGLLPVLVAYAGLVAFRRFGRGT